MLAITGSSGFIGKAICSHLPFPQRRLIRSHAAPVSNDSCIRIIGDLNRLNDCKQLLERADTLLHLACSSHPRNSSQPSHHMDDVAQSYQLFQAFAEMNPQGHIIFASTGGNMYSTEPPYVPRTELDLPLPASIYSIQKLSIEHHLRLICQKHGVKGTVLRISNPYGSILPSCRSQGLIGVTFSKLLSNESLHIIDSPESVRDYLHLDDLISAFNLVIKQHPKQGEFRLFNLSSGRGNSLIEVLNLIEEVTQRKIKKEYSYHHLKPSWSVLSSEKIKMALEWIPKIDLKQGLTKMWDEIQAEHLIAQTHS